MELAKGFLDDFSSNEIATIVEDHMNFYQENITGALSSSKFDGEYISLVLNLIFSKKENLRLKKKIEFLKKLIIRNQGEKNFQDFGKKYLECYTDLTSIGGHLKLPEQKSVDVFYPINPEVNKVKKYKAEKRKHRKKI